MIKITEEWYIEADSNCYIVHKITPADKKSIPVAGKTSNDKDVDIIYGYFTTMKSLIESVIKAMMREKVAKNTVTTLLEFNTELSKLKDQISGLINEDIPFKTKTKSVKKGKVTKDA